ncbi:BMC domain-containing protein [Anaerocolumna aminovalerica]|uniref:BMC domain-containing protein n=1 Tax=Anaerocolumna aminovalerica TaxID=1527 RepID=UPI000B889FE7|nr:BMC domain-containing protein [Anaerocolumna aminovalerica]
MINLKINAIGVVEVNFYTNAVTVLDEMMKASDVELVSCHKKLGGRMVHSIVAGETSSVNAAIEAANAAKSIVGEDNVKVAVTISNPHPEIIKLLNMIGE